MLNILQGARKNADVLQMIYLKFICNTSACERTMWVNQKNIDGQAVVKNKNVDKVGYLFPVGHSNVQ
jgi:hypothetical protein